MPHGVWPQADQDHPLPLVHCVEHGSPGLFLQVPDKVLRYAILEVGIDPAVRQALSLCLAVSNKCVVGEPTIVCVILEYFYSALVG